MATMITKTRSSETHENISSRHVRLCQRTKGAEILAQKIAPCIVKLAEKRLNTDKLRQQKDEHYDALFLVNNEMDDEIRTVHERCKQYDRENPGSPMLKTIFPDGKMSTVISASLKDQSMLVGQVIVRLNTLDDNHPLKSSAGSLQGLMIKEEEAQRLYSQAIARWKAALAEENMAKAELRKQYEHNYLDAVKLFGKRFAQRLFPKVKAKQKSEEESLPENN